MIKYLSVSSLRIKLTSLHLFAVLGHVVWPDGAQKLDVVITVVLGHLLTIGFVRSLKQTKNKLVTDP